MDSFNDYEMRWVLGEMLKVSDMDVGLLINFVKSQGIEPNWGQMLLPRGRNVDQCYYAAELMLNTRLPPPVFSPLKRKSLGDLPRPYRLGHAVQSSAPRPQTRTPAQDGPADMAGIDRPEVDCALARSYNCTRFSTPQPGPHALDPSDLGLPAA
ncbi:hypothetical protein N0V88_001763 [Collariella sp. IMI 366227]|nr:hypothetical protein N0V88_001763 [Collariella sp. IMI 366227]